MVITDKEQNIIWNTKTLRYFNLLNYDKILYPSDVQGTETYITVGQDKKHIEGYEVLKKHKDDVKPTRYFVRTEDVKDMPIEIIKAVKIHSKGVVYNLLVGSKTVKIPAKKVMDYREIIDCSGIPYHTNKLHYNLYKNKVLYGRIKGQLYYRTITESAFGKDKYKESVRLLLNESSLLSDPTVANLFYRACHNKDITINELPDTKNKSEFIKLCNMFMRLGDKTNTLDNRARSTSGTSDFADTSKLTLSFTHNVPSYYHDKGEKCYDDIYPYNVINRYYYNLYEGYLKAEILSDEIYYQASIDYAEYIKAWISSVKYYEENIDKMGNRFSTIPLFDFKFNKKEERFKDHFMDFAKALSLYAKDEKEYLELLHEEYKSHKNYDEMVTQFVPASEYKNQEVLM